MNCCTEIDNIFRKHVGLSRQPS